MALNYASSHRLDVVSVVFCAVDSVVRHLGAIATWVFMVCIP
jgi:hypothetical protein